MGVGDRLGVGVGVRLGFGVGVPVGGTVPDVNGSKMWLNCHVPCEIPEQLSLPPVPGQLPLSRCSAQNDSSAICWPTAQLSTAFASATVNVSAAPKSSMPTISVTPTMCQAVLTVHCPPAIGSTGYGKRRSRTIVILAANAP